MARIPTYERQQTQQVAQKSFHVDSTASAIVGGLQKGLSQASDVVSSIAKYEDVKAKQDYNLNTITRDQKIRDDSFALQERNDEIRAKMANRPDYKKANEELEAYTRDLLKNTPEGLDPKSTEEWKKSVYKQFDDLRTNNLKWGTTESARLAKKSQEKMAKDLFEMGLNRYGNSGSNHLPISENGLSLSGDGAPESDYILPKNNAEKAWQNENAREFFDRYLRETPLENPEKNNGIFFDMRTIEESEPKTFMGFTFKKGHTQRENGEKEIQNFFAKTIDTIDNHPALDDKSKEYLKSVAGVMEKERIQEFNSIMDGKAQEKQKEMGRPKSAFYNTIEYLNMMANRPQQMSAIEEKPLFSPRAEQSMLLSAGDEDIAYKYSTAPIGTTDFDSALTHALTSLEFPTGSYTRDQLYSKFAPNGTIMEVQTLEQILRNSPDLTITGAAIDAMKEENGFDETAWAYNAVAEIARMPDGTDDEKIRKTAAANHILYQAQKEINGGKGFKDGNLNYFVNAALSGIATTDGYSEPLVDQPNLMDMLHFNAFINPFDVLNPTPTKMAEHAIRNKGLKKAATEMLSGDPTAAMGTMRQTDKEVLQERFKNVLNIDDMERKLENHQPAFFTYNTVPYKYMGYDSENIYVEVANIKQKLKNF